MTQAQIDRTMAESIVRRSLAEIKRDPRRALRKLIDIGQETAGGHLQQEFMAMAQRLLQKDSSPYYTLIRNTVEQVDGERLMTFGMNLGWNSLTQGAKQIRANEAQRGFNIPWSLTLHMAQTPGSLRGKDYFRLVCEGVALGVYSYFLLPEDEPSVRCALGLIDACQGCAFCLLLPPSCDAETMLAASPAGKNAIVGIDSAAPGWARQADWLRAQGYPYLIFRTYATQADVEEIVSGRWAQQILPHAGVAAVTLARWGADALDDTQVYAYALGARMGQRYPTLMLDFYHDSLYTDVCISGDPCFLGVLPGGQVTEYQGGREVPVQASAREQPLDELLRRFPKTPRGSRG